METYSKFILKQLSSSLHEPRCVIFTNLTVQCNFCIYFRTSSSAIYSRTVPLGDSNEYFDQIWFPSEPPGVALRGPLCCRSAQHGKPPSTPLDETVHDPADNPEFSSFRRVREVSSPQSLLVSRRVCGA